jgi:hypothetical protein
VLATMVVALLASVPRAAGTQDPAAIEAPTPVEQAIIEQRCSATRATSAVDSDAYHNCLMTELGGIRADFGRDLTKLSPVERRSMDAACNKVRNLEGRDAYVSCLSGQLAGLHARRSPVAAAPAAPAPQQPADLNTLAQAVAAAPPSAGPSATPWIVAGVSVLLMAGAAGLFLMRRRPSSKCRTCGAVVPGGGDLCQACRHAAAEALRHAALERAEQERTEQEQIKRQHAQEEAWRIEQARQAELAQRHQLERAQREEQARREEEQRRREEDLRARSEYAAETVFDPYEVLGLAADASRESIESAYSQARKKYDADQVAHLSAEVQEHFKLKAEAVERAYQMLTAAV